MKRIKIVGGGALKNGVMFCSKNNYAMAEYNDSEELNFRHGKIEKKLYEKIILKIPILAGLMSLFQIFNEPSEPWKSVLQQNNQPLKLRLLSLAFTTFMFVVLITISSLFGSLISWIIGLDSYTFWNGVVLTLLVPIVNLGFIFLAAKADTNEFLNFHAAEHKVCNTYNKKLPLELNIVSSQSKIHNACSTNLVVISAVAFPFIFGALYAWTESFILGTILSIPVLFILGIEWLRIAGWISRTFLGNIFNVFGRLAQKYFTTREPRERHLRAGIAALNKLVEIENETARS